MSLSLAVSTRPLKLLQAVLFGEVVQSLALEALCEWDSLMYQDEAVERSRGRTVTREGGSARGAGGKSLKGQTGLTMDFECQCTRSSGFCVGWLRDVQTSSWSFWQVSERGGWTRHWRSSRSGRRHHSKHKQHGPG